MGLFWFVLRMGLRLEWLFLFCTLLARYIFSLYDLRSTSERRELFMSLESKEGKGFREFAVEMEQTFGQLNSQPKKKQKERKTIAKEQ